MTTVCYRDGILAVDSMVTSGDCLVGTSEKAKMMPDGSFVAHGGILADAELVFAWIAEGEDAKDKPSVDPDQFEAVRVYPNGRIVWYSGKLTRFEYTEHRGFFAFGSGERFALGAMAAGASAEEACRIACEFDTTSMEPVKTYTPIIGYGVQSNAQAAE
jgi:ATP-dependent protease HslVU (ClpYQ) peptidase subunit